MAAIDFSSHSEHRNLLALASHDLRDPVAALKLLLSAAVDELQAGGARRAQKTLSALFASMMRQTNELNWLVGCLADLSFLEQDLEERPLEDVDLAEVTESAVRRLSDASRLLECDLIFDPPDEVPGRWRRALLEVAIARILQSAIKSGVEKSIAVRVGFDGDIAWVAVEHHGLDTRGGDLSACLERDLLLCTAREIALALHASLVIDQQSGSAPALTLRLSRS